MEDFQEEGTEPRPASLTDRINALENKLSIGKMREESNKETTVLKFPGRWIRIFKRSKKKNNKDKIVFVYLNKEGRMEEPIITPVFPGNIIIYKNKPHEFDPRAFYTLKVKKVDYRVYIQKEIDRRPVSNLDIDEIKSRGDSTDSDEVLIKMIELAKIKESARQISRGVLIIGGIVIIGIIIFFLLKK